LAHSTFLNEREVATALIGSNSMLSMIRSRKSVGDLTISAVRAKIDPRRGLGVDEFHAEFGNEWVIQF